MSESLSHTLTGVWVEIYINRTSIFNVKSHTLTGVWVEIRPSCWVCFWIAASHPHGCVSWNALCLFVVYTYVVTPSRVCELKYVIKVCYIHCVVTPSRVCELKWKFCIWAMYWSCHTLTGVWVEIFVVSDSWQWNISSHPHGCVSWNPYPAANCSGCGVTPSRVCELK